MDLLAELLPVIVSIFGVFTLSGLILWSMTTIRYQVDSQYLRITWLGLAVRRIPLGLIKTVGHRPVFWAEHWVNTFRVGSGRLVLRLRTGYCKNIIISPANYIVFKAELERARKADVRAVAPVHAVELAEMERA